MVGKFGNASTSLNYLVILDVQVDIGIENGSSINLELTGSSQSFNLRLNESNFLENYSCTMYLDSTTPLSGCSAKRRNSTTCLSATT